MARQKIKSSEISKMSPIQILEDERVQGRFVEIVNGITRSDRGSIMLTREKEWFLRIITESPQLQECTPVSVFSAFMDLATLGLSVAKGTKPLAYLIPYTFNKGTSLEEKRMSLEVSPYGELAMRKNFGQIRDCNNPQLVYVGDKYREFEKVGQKLIEYEKQQTVSSTRKLKCGYVKITKIDGSMEYFSMDMNDVDRLRKFSEKKNANSKNPGANKLYTSNDGQIDEGFFIAKIIKHAFNAYPKSPYMQHVSAVLQTEKEEDMEIVNLGRLDDDVEEGEAMDVTDTVTTTTTTIIESNAESY